MKKIFYGILFALLLVFSAPNVLAYQAITIADFKYQSTNEAVGVETHSGLGGYPPTDFDYSIKYTSESQNSEQSFIDKYLLEQNDYKIKATIRALEIQMWEEEDVEASRWIDTEATYPVEIKFISHDTDTEYMVYSGSITGQQLFDGTEVVLDFTNLPMQGDYTFEPHLITGVVDEEEGVIDYTEMYAIPDSEYSEIGWFFDFFIGNKFAYVAEYKINDIFPMTYGLKDYFNAFESFTFNYTLTDKTTEVNYDLDLYYCTYASDEQYSPTEDDTCESVDGIDNASLNTKYFNTVVTEDYYNGNLVDKDYIKFVISVDSAVVTEDYIELEHDIIGDKSFVEYEITDATGHNVRSDGKFYDNNIKFKIDGTNFKENETYYVYITAGSKNDWENREYKTYTGKQLNDGIIIDIVLNKTKDSIYAEINSFCSYEYDTENCTDDDYFYLEHNSPDYTLTGANAFKSLQVKNLTLKATNYNTVQLDFDDVEGADGYQIWRATSKNGTYSLIGTTETSEFTYTKATLTKNYYYKVRAYSDASDDRVYSKYSSVKYIKAALLKPTITTTPYSYNSIKISWDKVDGATGYQVYRATSKTGKYTLVKATTGTSFTNTGLTTGKTYYYKVRAYRTISGTKYYGSYSTVKYTAPKVKAPGLKVTSYDYNINKVAITKPSGATGYQIYRSDASDGTFELIATTTNTTYYDKNLELGKTYYYKVRAYRTVSGVKKYGYESEIIESTPTLRTPTLTIANTSRDSLTLNIGKVNGADGYRIYTVINGIDTFLITTDQTEYVYENLPLGETYTFKVIAYKENETGEFTSIISNGVEATVKPATITLNVKVDSYNTQTVTANLKEVTADDEVKIYLYQGTSKTGTYKEYEEIPALNIENEYELNKTITGLKFNTTYYYKAIIEINGVKSEESIIKAAKTKLLTPEMTAVSNSYSSIKISWNKVGGATGYQVYRATSKTGKYTLVKTTNGTSFTNTGLTTGKTYYYKVRAYRTVSGKKYYSSYSTYDYAKPTVSTPTITATSYDYNINKITVTKKPSGTTGYAIYRSDTVDGTYTLLGTTTKTYYYDKKLTTGKTYYYKVRAYRTVSGSKKYSNYSEVVSMAPIVKKTSFTINNSLSKDYLKLTIIKVNGADGYHIYRDSEKIMTITELTYIDENVEYGKEYTYKVVPYRTVNENEVLGFESDEVVAIVRPATPKITITNNGYNKQTISLSNTDLNDGDTYTYYLYRSTSKNSGYDIIYEGTDSTVEVTDLSFNKTYYYYAVIKINDVESNKSTTVGKKTALTAPTTSAKYASKSSIKVSWDKVEGATGYQVYRATSKTGTYTLVKTATGTSFTNTGLTTGKTYYYKVRAYRTVSGKKVYGSYSTIVSEKPRVS